MPDPSLGCTLSCSWGLSGGSLGRLLCWVRRRRLRRVDSVPGWTLWTPWLGSFMSGLLGPFEICPYSDHVCFRLWWHWCNVGTCVLWMIVIAICICSMSFWLYFVSFLCVVLFWCDNDSIRPWYLSYASRFAYVTVGSGVCVGRWSIPSRPVERFSAWLGKPASYTLCGPLGMTPLYKFEAWVWQLVSEPNALRNPFYWSLVESRNYFVAI